MKQMLHRIFDVPAWKTAGGFRVQPPHALVIFAAILLSASCTKEMPDDWMAGVKDDTRWWVNTELPVPVTFAFSSGTKGHAIESVEQLEGVEFGLLAAGDYQREDPVLYDGKARVENGKVAFTQSEDGALYYPKNSENDYSFYAYYTGPDNSGYSVRRTDDERYMVDIAELGNHDILVSVPSVATPIAKPGDDGVLYHGFNAAYARASYLWYGNSYVPKLEFMHACAAIQFHVSYQKFLPWFFPNEPGATMASARVDYVATSAELDLASGELIAYDQHGSIIQDERAGLMPDGVMMDNTFFVAPGEHPYIEFGFTILRLFATYDISVSHEDIAKIMGGNVTFERGGRYIFDVNIIETSLSPDFTIEINPHRK